jgi:hypothetical protein
MARFARVLVLLFAAVSFVGMIPQAGAQVTVRIGHRSRHRHHRHYYYRHGHRYCCR